MADRKQDEAGRRSSDLQASQSGGGSGEFGGNRDQIQRSGQQGGGAGSADMSNSGGSSGTGGYGSSQNVVNHQDQQQQAGAQDGLAGADLRQSGGAAGGDRGERFDEEQGGGRGWREVSPSADEAALAEEQGAHQDRGQSEAETEFNAEAEGGGSHFPSFGARALIAEGEIGDSYQFHRTEGRERTGERRNP